jgi:hypothetical protein
VDVSRDERTTREDRLRIREVVRPRVTALLLGGGRDPGTLEEQEAAFADYIDEARKESA